MVRSPRRQRRGWRKLAWAPLALPLVACQGSPSGSARAHKLVPDREPVAAGLTTTSATADPSSAKGSIDEPIEIPTDAAIATDVRAANDFTLRILWRTKGKPADSAMVSGTSIRHTLGAAYIGAGGTTAQEMATALGFDDDPKKAASLARAELHAWRDARGDAELSVASRLWVDTSFAIRRDFAKTAESAFGASPASVEFARPERARSAINRWVSEQTKDKIPELLPQGSVDPQTRLVVTNAIWFKGRWEQPFPKDATKDETFKTPSRDVTTPMMHLSTSLRHAAPAGAGAQILEMPYEGSRLAMLIVLPNDPGGVSKVEQSLSAETLAKWTGALKKTRVNVTLPKFEKRTGGAMRSALEDLGVKTAFTSNADFRGIAAPSGREEPLYLGEVFHQTWISVDEIGTEAAAATGAVLTTTSLDLGPIVDFRVDHPFLFFIYEPEQGRVLFAGRVVDPKG